MRILYLCTMLIGLSSCLGDNDKTKYVDPLIGTLGIEVTDSKSFTRIEKGLVAPIVGVPNGMTSWVPQTVSSEEKCACPYLYRHTAIQGFRASHWLNGGCTQDYGSFTVMPIVGNLKIKPEERAYKYKHEDEISTPYCYKVELDNKTISAQITGLSHSSIFKFSYSSDDKKYLIIDINSDEGEGYIRIDSINSCIYGYNPVHRIYNGWGKPSGFSGYFIIKFPEKFIESGVWHDWKLNNTLAEIKGNGKNVGAYVRLNDDLQNLELKIGTSFTSFDAAEENLNIEIGDKDYDEVLKESKKQWNDRLNKIEVKGDEKLMSKFYSAFYLASILPRQYSDIKGSYPAFATQYVNKLTLHGKYYDDFSMWDTYPIISPSMTNDFVRSMILKSEQGGWLPIFPCWNSYTSAMIGDHVTTMIADAFVKGIKDYDVEKAYYYMKKNAFEINTDSLSYVDGKGRRALESYMKYGYIPMEDKVLDAFHMGEQVSRTLEYAHDDYSLAQMAKKLGKIDDYKELISRSKNYINVFDSVSGYVRGRFIDGSWIEPFDPFKARESDKNLRFLTEASAFQYTWYVPHDVEGLIKLLGGKDKFISKLDKFFKEGHYAHSNEPSHHIAYLYAYAGQPWKVQEIIPDIVEECYKLSPDGLIGNDDAGQMSSWLLMSMMGFYQVCPGTTEYVIGTPMFEESVINLENGRTFTIKADGVSSTNRYIQSAVLNGKPLNKSFIDHHDIINGGTLLIKMGDKPNKSWGNIID